MGLVVVEAIGAVCMWAPIPLAWFWIGARVYEATGSMAADLAVIGIGFGVSCVLMMKVLAHVDQLWIELRQRAGHKQASGALNQVVVVSATLGILAFLVWAYLIDQAFIMPFMPNQ